MLVRVCVSFAGAAGEGYVLVLGAGSILGVQAGCCVSYVHGLYTRLCCSGELLVLCVMSGSAFAAHLRGFRSAMSPSFGVRAQCSPVLVPD